MNVIEYRIDEEDEDSGVFAISLVNQPAIESDFITLNSIKVDLKVTDEERGLLMGAVLIPNKPIFRRDADGEEYNIYFSKETVRKASELYLKRGFQSSTTLEHRQKLKDNFIVETWIKEDDVHDKSVKFGIDAPVGSWLASIKISDPEVMKLAKSGVINGFSIEGLFTDKVEASIEEEILELLNKLQNERKQNNPSKD